MDHLQYFAQVPDAIDDVWPVIGGQHLGHLPGSTVHHQLAFVLSIDPADVVAVVQHAQNADRHDDGILRELGRNAEALDILKDPNHLKIERFHVNQAAELMPAAKQPRGQRFRKHADLAAGFDIESADTSVFAEADVAYARVDLVGAHDGGIELLAVDA